MKLKIEYINIDELIPYINNPRINDNAVDVVAGSIKEFGFKNPIIIDSKNVIIAGHTRYKVAKLLKLEHVPTVRVEDLNDTQIKAYRLIDNKVSEIAEWDYEKLQHELEEIYFIEDEEAMADYGFEKIESQLNQEVEYDEDGKTDFTLVLTVEESELLDEIEIAISNKGIRLGSYIAEGLEWR